MSDEPEPRELPKRIRGTHLPAALDRPIGTARVPDTRWSSDDPVLRMLLNGLRRWRP